MATVIEGIEVQLKLLVRLETVPVQLLGRPDGGTVLSVDERTLPLFLTHMHCRAHSCTPEEVKPQHESRDISTSITKSSVQTGTSLIYPATLFYIPHIIDHSHSITYEMIRNLICLQIQENKPAHKMVMEQTLLYMSNIGFLRPTIKSKPNIHKVQR